MDNFILFVCGLSVTLVSAFGVIVYVMTPPYYEKPPKKPEPDIDLGATNIESLIAKRLDHDSLEIPSVS